MKKTIIILILFLLLAACGDVNFEEIGEKKTTVNDVEITLIFVSQEFLNALNPYEDKSLTIGAWANIFTTNDGIKCDIYIMPVAMYANIDPDMSALEAFIHAFNHERRHCFEGNWHGNTPTW